MVSVTRVLWPAALCGALLVVAGQGLAFDEAGSLSEGKQLYLQACGACHGVDGRGAGPVAPALASPPRDLTALANAAEGTFSRAQVAAVITGTHPIAAHGSAERPVWTVRFSETGTGGVAGIYAQRHLELVLGHLEAIQAAPALPARAQ